MRKIWTKCVYILILQFVFVAGAFANTLTVDEAGNVLAETDRYEVRFRDGVLIHFHNKLTNETYTLPPQDGSNEQSGISIQYNEGEYGRDIHIDKHWKVVESKRLTPLSVEVAYYSDYRVDKTVRIRISIDADTGDLVIQQHGTSERVVSIMWGCGYLNTQQLDIIVPGNGGEIIDAATKFNNRGFEYPKGWEAQLAILQGEDGGFFVRSTDTTFRFKSLGYRRTAEHFGMRFQTDNFAPFGEKNEITSVEWRLNAYRGDWQVPALYYRDWMETVFQPRQPRAWIKDIKLIVNLTNLKQDKQGILRLLAAHADPSTTLIHLNGWEGPGWGEPDYIPLPEFGAFLEAAHGYGFRVMPRVNFIGCSPNHPLYPELEKHQFRHPIRGHKLGYELNNPTYDSPSAYINPASNAFRKYLVGQLKTLSETYPIDAFHLDINHFIGNDANGLIDGLTPAEGNVLLHQELAEAMPGIVFGGESLHEVTSLHVDLAMRWFIPEGAQPHPISSFLFSPWTIPYAHTSVPNPDADGQPERNQAIIEAYIVWNVLPTIRIHAPWMLEPYRVRTLGFLESIRNGQSREQTWNIDVGMDIVGDVNGDGVVNIQDLVIVANAFGKAEPDVNGDGVVNIQDLVIVAQNFD